MVFAARLCGSRVPDFHPAGALSQRSRTVFETLPFCLSSARQSFSEAREAGRPPELAQPRPSRSPRFPGGRRPPRGPTETGFLHLPRRWLASSPEAKWPRLRGIQTAAGVRCGPRQLPFARKGDSGWVCNSQPTNSRKGRSTSRGPSREGKRRELH